MLKHAMRLAEAGFSVIWLKNKSKAPISANWTSLPTKTAEELDRTYVPGRNVGIRLGEPSRVQGFYVHVIDMDIRDPDYAEETRERLVKLLELDGPEALRDFPTVISGSGGESRHFYFCSDRPYRSKKLWHSAEKMVDSAGKEHWCAEIELFGTGKQVAAPPSIHPDTGNPYVWEDGFEATEALIPDLESSLLDRLTGQNDEEEVVYDAEQLGISYAEAEEYLKELDLNEWCEDRAGWVKVGMALHHEFDGSKEAYQVWVDFSKQSRKFNSSVHRDQWRSFKSNKEEVVTFASIIKAANESVYIREYESLPGEFEEDDDEPEQKPLTRKEIIDLFNEDDEDQDDDPSKVRVSGIPDHLLTIPGVLGKAVDFYNKTSIRWQPQFAVQTCLALGAVVLGRYWRTDEQNYAHLYLVSLGDTGAGKEYAREFTSRILEACKLAPLIGPSSYASESAVLGTLRYRPRHIAILDEFGRLLGSTRDSSSTNLKDAQTTLMSAFGIGNAAIAPKAFSANGKSDKQIAQEMTSFTKRPSITILGLSTPTTFYDSLGNEALLSGFLNRFLVVASRTKKQRWRSRRDVSFDPPRALLSWIDDYALTDELHEKVHDDFKDVGNGDGQEEVKEIGIGESVDQPEEPVTINFSDRARVRIEEIFDWIEDRKEELKATRRNDMYGRAHEITMRLSLIVALSCRAKKVDQDHINWAWDYVQFYTEQMVTMAGRMLGSNETVRLAEAIAEFITSKNGAWVPLGQINKYFPEFYAMPKRNRDEIMDRVFELGIEAGKLKSKGGGGRAHIKYRSEQ
ncbi:bifunctional DNA primase/polymerase [Ochrobactrum sp. GPK 3]